jgi:hypothetical protein
MYLLKHMLLSVVMLLVFSFNIALKHKVFDDINVRANLRSRLLDSESKHTYVRDCLSVKTFLLKTNVTWVGNSERLFVELGNAY